MKSFFSNTNKPVDTKNYTKLCNAHKQINGNTVSTNHWITRYIKHTAKNRHQHNTDDGGQAMGEELRHVQMSR